MFKYSYNKEVFLNEDDISYYLLGLYITDGNLHNGAVSLLSIDNEIIEKIRDLICPEKTIYSVKSYPKAKRFRIHNKEIYNWFIKHGCVPNKTKIVEFPNIPQKYISHFMRGLIDGDGSIGFYKNSRSFVRFDSASLSLITGFLNQCDLWGIKAKIAQTPWIETVILGKRTASTTQMYRVALSGLKAYKFLKFIYSGDRLSFSRKKKTTIDIFNFIERNGFSEEECLSFDRLPPKKWKSDQELIECFTRHKGSLVLSGRELGVAGWTLCNRLNHIGKYDELRKLFPVDNIKNITSNFDITSKSKILNSDQVDGVYKLLDNGKLTHQEIGLLFGVNKHYIAYLVRKRKKIKTHG